MGQGSREVEKIKKHGRRFSDEWHDDDINEKKVKGKKRNKRIRPETEEDENDLED
mgnify:CR=1 FL=1